MLLTVQDKYVFVFKTGSVSSTCGSPVSRNARKCNYILESQWSLYKAASKFYGLSKRVVFLNREIIHDFIRTDHSKWWNLCAFAKTLLISLHRFHCVTKNSALNSLWPSDAIWWQRFGSTVAQVMAWCCQAPSHYLNQCWFIITGVLWLSSIRPISQEVLKVSIHKPGLKITLRKLLPHLPGSNDLKKISTEWVKPS